MSADCRISVLVPVYGVERFVGRCARSLFAQTLHEGVEFLFVDDASPDASLARLEAALAGYPGRRTQVRILHHDRNRGLAAARATALAAAQGEYVLHVDSDDYLCRPDALALLLAEARRTGADLVTGRYRCVTGDTDAGEGSGEPFGPTAGPACGPRPGTSREELLRHLLAQDFRVANRIWGLLIRRTLYTDNDIRPPEAIHFAEDYATLPRLVYCARTVTAIEEALYAYRTDNAASYMRRLDRRAAEQYVAANRTVSDFMRRQPDYARWEEAVIRGKLNVEKWILKRGLRPADFHADLFADGYAPHRPTLRLYAALLHRGWLRAAQGVGWLLNR